MPAPDWNQRYRDGDLPWDTGQPDPTLVELVESRRITPGRTLEIGCGTGTNALWLAAQGFEVIGTDLSPVAIEQAGQKRSTADLACEFRTVDFLSEDVPGGPFGLIFDRGCFHTFDDADRRARFAARVANLLAPDGRWVSLIGSTEGPERDHGPPRRSARDIASAIEPVLEIAELKAIAFHADIPSPARAWLCIASPRAVPAQPSTVRT